MVRVPETAKLLNKAIIFAIIVCALSFFINIVPCSVSIGSFFSDGFCKLPNPFKDIDISQFQTSTSKFYWISTNPLTGLVMQFLFPTIAFIIIYMIIKRKSFGKRRAKVVDFTKK